MPSRLLALVFLTLLVAGTACSAPIRTALCGLSSYAVEITGDLDALLALDPEQVAETGTPDNVAALAALDRLDATAAEGQEALDSASEDDVGEVIRRLFQAALDATGLATDALRSAIATGDPAAVTEAMGQVQLAVDAIDAFVAAVDNLGIECPSASPSAIVSEAPSEAASEAPSAAASATTEPTPESTPEATATPTASPTPAPTATPTAAATETASPTASATPTASPTPTPTPSASPSPSASASESASAEPTPAPSEAPGEDGGLNLTWLAVLGAGALGALVYVLVSRARTPPTDGGPGAAADAGSQPPLAEPPEELAPDEVSPDGSEERP